MDYETAKALTIVILMGLAIGMQRTLSYMAKGEQSSAGSRSFALVALLGYLSGWMDSYEKGFILVSFCILGFLTGITYYLKVKEYGKRGITTQIAFIITYFVGLMVYLREEKAAIFISVVLIALLEIKPRLQSFEARVSRTDINATLLLLLMTFVVLPLLPDRMIGPYELFNPYKTWLMAVVISAISFIGYAAVKILGHRRGVFITGAAGGFISSTAVSVSLSRMFSENRRVIESFAGGIAIASTFMYLRVLFETAVIDSTLAVRLAPAFLAAALSGSLFVWYLYRHSGNSEDIELESDTISRNPLQLSEAVKFGLLFGVIYGAVEFVQGRYGNIGVYIVSFLSGLTDVDAITLSLSELAKSGKLETFASMNGIVIASVVNSLVKLSIVFWLGGSQLGKRLALFYAITLTLMGAGLYLGKYL